MKIVINTNYKSAGTKVCVDDLTPRLIAAGHSVARNDWKNYGNYDVALFMAPDSEVKKAKAARINPATKTFMALRLAVNLEREALRDMLVASPNLLTRGGILGVISFHSGEDRLVKHFLKQKKKAGILRLINVKPLKPNEKELQTNPKVRSAKLRLAQKI